MENMESKIKNHNPKIKLRKMNISVTVEEKRNCPLDGKCLSKYIKQKKEEYDMLNGIKKEQGDEAARKKYEEIEEKKGSRRSKGKWRFSSWKNAIFDFREKALRFRHGSKLKCLKSINTYESIVRDRVYRFCIENCVF